MRLQTLARFRLRLEVTQKFSHTSEEISTILDVFASLQNRFKKLSHEATVNEIVTRKKVETCLKALNHCGLRKGRKPAVEELVASARALLENMMPRDASDDV